MIWLQIGYWWTFMALLTGVFALFGLLSFVGWCLNKLFPETGE